MPRASSPPPSLARSFARSSAERGVPAELRCETRVPPSGRDDECHAERHDAERQQVQGADAERMAREDREDAENDGDHREDPSDYGLPLLLRTLPGLVPSHSP